MASAQRSDRRLPEAAEHLPCPVGGQAPVGHPAARLPRGAVEVEVEQVGRLLGRRRRARDEAAVAHAGRRRAHRGDGPNGYRQSPDSRIATPPRRLRFTHAARPCRAPDRDAVAGPGGGAAAARDRGHRGAHAKTRGAAGGEYDDVLDAVLERESVQSTGIGFGVAIPHGVAAVRELRWWRA